MSPLDTSPRLARPDDVFEALLKAHDALDPAACARFDARLILLLANQVGDTDLVLAAIRLAQDQAA